MLGAELNPTDATSTDSVRLSPGVTAIGALVQVGTPRRARSSWCRHRGTSGRSVGIAATSWSCRRRWTCPASLRPGAGSVGLLERAVRDTLLPLTEHREGRGVVALDGLGDRAGRIGGRREDVVALDAAGRPVDGDADGPAGRHSGCRDGTQRRAVHGKARKGRGGVGGALVRDRGRDAAVSRRRRPSTPS